MPSQSAMIIDELRALLRLTETEIQIADTRRAQARTEAVERELAQNADNARRRAHDIASVLRSQGGSPDVLVKTVGRLNAAAKSNLEQAQPLTEALLGDLALEHQLQDRAHLLKALAVATDRRQVINLADRLIEAHGATIEWLTVVLAEVALGGPAALRPTPVQAVLGAGLHLATFPVRTVGRGVEGVIDRASLLRSRVGSTSDTISDGIEDAREAVTSTVHETQERATSTARNTARGTARTLRDARRTANTPDDSELPVEGYGSYTKPRAIAAVKKLSSVEELRTVIAYEEGTKNRADVVSAAQAQIARLAREVVLT